MLSVPHAVSREGSALLRNVATTQVAASFRLLVYLLGVYILSSSPTRIQTSTTLPITQRVQGTKK